VRHPSDVHWIVSPQLWLPVHVTSHAHELSHATLRHELAPLQLTSHGPMPHWMLRHEPVPEQVRLHDSAAWQSTPLRHELSVSHMMLHL
jgi:hypothetical protein